jgi:hypothetical protein
VALKRESDAAGLKAVLLVLPFLALAYGCADRVPSTLIDAALVDGSKETKGDAAFAKAVSVTAQVFAMSYGKGPKEIGLTLSWADGVPSSPLIDTNSVSIRRGFDTVAAAKTYQGTFVANLHGGEIGREPAHLGLCAVVAQLGFDASKRKTVVVRREVDFSASVSPKLSTTLHWAYTPYLSCLLEPMPRGVIPEHREMHFRFPLGKQTVKFLLNGVPMEPADIGYWGDGSRILYLLRIKHPYAKPVYSIHDVLSVTTGGQTYKLTVGFSSPCPAEQVAVETQSLHISNGKLQVDGNGGWTCLYTDGTKSYGTP